MKLFVEHTPIRDVKVISHEVFDDDRGFFVEVFRRDMFAEAGLPTEFVQLNHSRSRRNVLRGLHFQWEPPMGKMMRVVEGAAFLVAVDIRLGSPTLGKWFGIELSAQSKQQLWAPAGCARGFCALSEYCQIEYLCTGTYNGPAESGILWSDPDIGIDWPVKQPILSARDQGAQTLAAWLAREEAHWFTF